MARRQSSKDKHTSRVICLTFFFISGTSQFRLQNKDNFKEAADKGLKQRVFGFPKAILKLVSTDVHHTQHFSLVTDSLTRLKIWKLFMVVASIIRNPFYAFLSHEISL